MKQDKITINGPKNDGTYIVEFKTADGVALAFSVPKGGGTAVLEYFQDKTSLDEASAKIQALVVDRAQKQCVDLKLKWQPVLAHLLGLPGTITFDSQSVERMEF